MRILGRLNLARKLTPFDLENYRLDLVTRGSSVLVVTFEPMTACRRNPSRDRAGWGAKFLRPRTEDVLYVKPTAPHWYRRPDLFEWIDTHRAIFGQYDRVVLMGGSMGGYGALAFADVMQATEVLSLNPQSTLAPALVPWENRFAIGQKEDWDGPFHDAAQTLRGKVIVISDKFEKLDQAHVRRLKNITHLNFPMVGHRVPEWLMQLDVLKALSTAVIAGDDPTPIFRAAMKRRRELERWWAGLVETGLRHGKDHLVQKHLSPEVLTRCIPMDENAQDLKKIRRQLYQSVARELKKTGRDTDADAWAARAQNIVR